jgi:hypothetical protein
VIYGQQKGSTDSQSQFMSVLLLATRFGFCVKLKGVASIKTNKNEVVADGLYFLSATLL